MKRLSLTLLLLPFITAVHAQQPANLLPNASFETLTADGFPESWRGGEFGKPGANVVADSTVAHSGKTSLRVGTSVGSFVTCQAAPVTVKPSTTYYVTWWCRTEGLGMARAYVWLQTNKAQRTVPDDSQYGTTAWTQHFARYTTAADETTLAPVATTHHTTGVGGFAWFDDLGVYEGSFPAELQAVYKAYQRNQSGVSETAVVLSKSPSLTVWGDSLAARIYKEEGVPDYARPAKTLELSGARGEHVYVQVALLPAQALAEVTLAPTALKGPATIPAEAVSVRPVGFANIKQAHRTDTRLGLTPDPILKASPVALGAGQNAPFLIAVTIPRDARPGQYATSVAVAAAGKPVAAIPLSLRVYDFSLPEDPVFRTLITYSASSFKPRDPRPLEDIEHDIARVLYEHGVRGNGATLTVPARLVDGQVVCDFTDFDRRVQWFQDNLRFNAFFLGPCFGGGTSEGWEKHNKWLGMEPLDPQFTQLFPQYLRQVGAHLREKGWLDNAYLYLWDEPEPSYFDKVVALQKLALQGDPGFKIWETTSPNYEAFYGVVKAWSVPFGRPYFSEESVEKRRAAGDEIWVYNIPASLEIAPQRHRLWFWQAARYGAIGAQLWQTTFYNKIDPWEEITPVPWVTGHHQESLYVYDAGEAILLYPDRDGGPPLPSLRLKLIQKGIDDFTYLTLLQQRLEARAKARGVADAAAQAQKQMREITATLVKDLGKYNSDYRALEKTRDDVAKQIERLK